MNFKMKKILKILKINKNYLDQKSNQIQILLRWVLVQFHLDKKEVKRIQLNLVEFKKIYQIKKLMKIVMNLNSKAFLLDKSLRREWKLYNLFVISILKKFHIHMKNKLIKYKLTLYCLIFLKTRFRKIQNKYNHKLVNIMIRRKFNSLKRNQLK